MAEEDIIFGKKRHFFGGIEPSNMLVFNAKMDNEAGRAIIEATLPDDTMVGEQTLCSVAGAIIRRREDRYPEDEFDGTVVADIKESTEIVDTDVSPNGTYYYSAFPYSKQGVYNRSNKNRTVVNEPECMAGFTSEFEYYKTSDTAVIVIDAKLPSSVVGAVIRKSNTYYPLDENDGELFANITEDTVLRDTDVECDTTYYYSAFPYTSTGAYNRSTENRTKITPTRREYLFGYDLDLSDSNPSTRVTYPTDVDNSLFNKAYMNFTSETFDYGDWPSEPGEKFMPRPCMLKSDGTVDYYLNPNDYTKKLDGSSSSIASTSYGGNAMMEWPKIYTKRWEENGVYHFRCSDMKVDSGYECWCNYDKNDNPIDKFYTGIYSGYVSGTSDANKKVRSLSGQTPAVTSSEYLPGFARNNGDDWTLGTVADWLLIQDLLVMISKTTDGQTAFGNGVSSNGTTIVNTGTLNTKGMFWGVKSWTSSVKVFGMEDWWGNCPKMLDGWIFKAASSNGTHYLKITRGVKDGTTASDYNLTGSGYLTTDNKGSGFNSTSSYPIITNMETTPYGRIPYGVSSSASSNMYEADSIMATASKTCWATVGGPTNGGNGNGPFTVYFNVYTAIGAYGSISCKPTAVISEEE